MKSKIDLIDSKEVDVLYNDIKKLVEESRNRVYKTVNTEMIKLYWNIGELVVNKQNGNHRAKYGDYLIDNISKKITNDYGKGFSQRKILPMLPKRDNNVVPIVMVSLFRTYKNRR